MSFARRWKRRHPACVLCGASVDVPGGRRVLPLCGSCLPIVAKEVSELAELLEDGYRCTECLSVVVCEAGDGSCPA